jgi:anti-sigma factor RsiW
MRCADDELAGWRLAWLRSHLGTCRHCEGELAQLRRLRGAIAGRKEHYLATMDEPLFWQRLRANLQSSPEAPPDPNLVMAFSRRQPALAAALPPVESQGFALFGLASTKRLALAATAVAVLAVALLGFWVARGPQSAELSAADIPVLAPAGANRVSFGEVTYKPDIWAGVVRFDKPDVDITVIWVTGDPELWKEPKPDASDS